jgi:hypothetical protein
MLAGLDQAVVLYSTVDLRISVSGGAVTRVVAVSGGASRWLQISLLRSADVSSGKFSGTAGLTISSPGSTGFCVLSLGSGAVGP